RAGHPARNLSSSSGLYVIGMGASFPRTAVGKSALIGQPVGRLGQAIGRSGAAKLAGDVAQIEPRHLVLQRAERDPQIAGAGGHVPVRFLERAENEVPLERV